MARTSRVAAKAKVRVKSGCRTCKIRKVKCDEGRPACQRCTQSGRTCDGYGIWGGGGGPVAHCAGTLQNPSLGSPSSDYSSPSLALSRSPGAYPVFSLSSHYDEMETMAFDWFKTRTATKLPGSYHSSFWGTLIYQATLGEEAVWHTALALGAFHRTRILRAEDCTETTDYLPAKEGKFMLQHYVTAISQLRRLLSTKDRSSYRVALVICIMFTAMDFLRGHHANAQMHLRNGLKVMAEVQGISSRSKQGGTDLLTHSIGQEDRWLAEAYSRLHLQIQFWKPRSERRWFSLADTDHALSLTAGFRTLPDAWKGWEGIINRILSLTDQARLQEGAKVGLIEQRECIRSDLDRWLDRYQRSDLGLPPVSTEKADALIRAYHSMAAIMAETCLCPGDEMVYDLQTDRFLDMMSHLLRLLTGKDGYAIYGLSNSSPTNNFAWSIVDFGNIQSLYYIAIKCRVHRIRLQAVRLLEICSHREGIWESKAAGYAARKVMELEENGSCYAGLVDEFPLLGRPQASEKTLPNVPASQRICDVEIEMEGTPTDTILIFGYKADQRVLLSTYNCDLMKWHDNTVLNEPFKR